MHWLHLTRKHRTKPAPVAQGFVNYAAAKQKRDVGTIVAKPHVDVLDHAGTDVSNRSRYLSQVVRCQAAPRVCRKHTAVAAGSTSGLAGLAIGLIAGPFFPVVGLGAAAIGAAMGAALPLKEEASFRQVRKHMFYKSGIVDSRAKSAALVAALKKSRVLDRGRARNIHNLNKLDAVLKQQPGLSPKQRQRVQESLRFIAQEGPWFDALALERARLAAAIAQARLLRGDKKIAAPQLQALCARQAQVAQRLLPGSGGPKHMQLQEIKRPLLQN